MFSLEMGSMLSFTLPIQLLNLSIGLSFCLFSSVFSHYRVSVSAQIIQLSALLLTLKIFSRNVHIYLQLWSLTRSCARGCYDEGVNECDVLLERDEDGRLGEFDTD